MRRQVRAHRSSGPASVPSLAWRLREDERGSSLVEYAMAVSLFFLLFFAVIDFGRMLHDWVMAEKAVQMAARTAAVRNPVCGVDSLPTSNLRGSATGSRFGNSCSTEPGTCAGEESEAVFCSGPATPPTCPVDGAGYTTTIQEIWCKYGPLMPPNAAPDNLRFTYTFDPQMNFLGGPYVPVVTVELQDLDFVFVSPLEGLAAVFGAIIDLDGISFPPMSVSLPGEDLALGTAG